MSRSWDSSAPPYRVRAERVLAYSMDLAPRGFPDAAPIESALHQCARARPCPYTVVLDVAAALRQPAHEERMPECHPAALGTGLETLLVHRAGQRECIQVHAGTPVDRDRRGKPADLLLMAAFAALPADRLPPGASSRPPAAQPISSQSMALLWRSAKMIHRGISTPASSSTTGHKMLQRARRMPSR